MTFADKVLRKLKNIPKGKVTTYSKLACSLGSPRAFRAVGNALHINPHPVIVPCHRVVRSNGEVGGYALGQKRKILLLKKEGVKFLSLKKISNESIV